MYNFTDGVRSTLRRARENAATLRHDHVRPGHILLSLIEQGELQPLLEAEGQHGAALRDAVLGDVLPPAGTTVIPREELPYDQKAKQTLEVAMATAMEWQQNWVGSEHLLVGLLQSDSRIAGIFRARGVDPRELVERVTGARTTVPAEQISMNAGDFEPSELLTSRARAEYSPVQIAQFRRIIRRRRIGFGLLLVLLPVVRIFQVTANHAPAGSARHATATLWLLAMVVIGALMVAALFRLFSCPACGTRLPRSRDRQACAQCGLAL